MQIFCKYIEVPVAQGMIVPAVQAQLVVAHLVVVAAVLVVTAEAHLAVVAVAAQVDRQTQAVELVGLAATKMEVRHITITQLQPPHMIIWGAALTWDVEAKAKQAHKVQRTDITDGSILSNYKIPPRGIWAQSQIR